MKLFSFTQLALAVLGSNDIRARMMQRYNPDMFEDSEPLSRRGRNKPRRFRQHNQQQEQELMQALDELPEQDIIDMLEFKEFMRDLDLNF